MKALVRLSEGARRRNLIEISPEELVKSVINTVDVINIVMQESRSVTGRVSKELPESFLG